MSEEVLMDGTRMRCRRAPWNDSIEILVIARNSQGERFIGQPITMETRDVGLVIITPTIILDNTNAQLLMDELWNCGLRPSEGSGSAGSLAATERHLADMQKLVFKGK